MPGRLGRSLGRPAPGPEMRAIGWALFAVTCALVVLQGVFLAASNFPFISSEVLVDHVFPLLGIGAIVGAGVGALIVSRYPRNLVGWLFLVGQLGHVIALAALAFRVLVAQGVVDARLLGQVAGYLGDIFGTVFTVSVMSLIFMTAPDGQLLSRRWRLAAAVPVAAQLLWWAGAAARPPDAYLADAAPSQSLRETFTAELLTLAGFFAMLLSLTLGAVALVLRLHRSTGQQRLQLRWIASGAAVLTVIFIIFALGDLLPIGVPWILPELTALAYIFFSVSVGVAIFRYRLYNIDVFLSRAIALGVLAVFVTVGYIAVVVAISWLLTAIGAPGSTLYWPSLVATALVAVAFQPIRQHVLRLADQLVYGSRAAPYEALAALSRRLADSPSSDALPERVAEATGRAVGAARVIVRLGEPGELSQARIATWPATATRSEPAADGRFEPAAPIAAPALSTGPAGTGSTDAPGVVLPVLDTGERVGDIEISMPPGRALRTFERDLLEDVAAQAGVAFRNALLEAELADRVNQGQVQSAALAASRRRLVDVEDEARERLAGAIQRGVVPHLVMVDRELSAAAAGPAAAADVEPLIAATELALEQLRMVCRGVFPALLERRGLVPALSAQLPSSHPYAVLEADSAASGRLDRAAEAAGYLFCVEAAPTDRACVISLLVRDEQLAATVSGDESWAPEVFEGTADLSGRWQHVRDRVAALDGTITALRGAGGDLSVTALIPIDDQQDRELVMVAQTSSSRSGPKRDLDT
ncbi:MAG: hypothetical protein ABWZ98_11490 [Nakamurella sp.]